MYLYDNLSNEVRSCLTETGLYDAKRLYAVDKFLNSKLELRCPWCGKIYFKSYKTIQKTGAICLSCIKSSVAPEYSLAAVSPYVANMYDQADNGIYKIPSDRLNPGSCTRKVNFLCERGHTWASFPSVVVDSVMNRHMTGCPVCSNRRIQVGSNDFESKFPEYSKFWSSKNKLKPDEVIATSTKKFWFSCPKEGHGDYQQILASVTKTGLHCPVCENRKVLTGYNDFATKAPKLSSIWAYDLNNGIKPTDVIYGSASSFWFRCNQGHEFQKPLYIIIESEGQETMGCPYCNGSSVLQGYNDFKSKYPELAEMWDYSKNIEVPENVYYRSNSYFWFKCKKAGHEFRKMPVDLIEAQDKRSAGCPVCAGRISVVGSSDYYIAEDERMEKRKNWVVSNILNKEVLPRFFTSDVFGEFKCDQGHLYKRNWANIRRYGYSCPVCTGHVLVKGFNDFETCRPDLLKYWDYTSNNILPSECTKSSSEEVSWLCVKCGASFRQRINTRITTRGLCPNCAESYSRSFAEKEIADFIAGYVDVETNVKVNGKELDIYIPSLKIAFEYNGLYYHSEEKGKDKEYHFLKYVACMNAGITLYAIWEDDYNFKKERVLSWIKEKIGVADERKVNARDCTLVNVNVEDAKEFLQKYHIQGNSPLSIHIGLLDKCGELVSVLSYVEQGDSLVIRRYCTSCNVRGGFSKLLKHLEASSNVKYIVTFSDNAVSYGKLYSSTGFVPVELLDPDYSYIYKDMRYHKFNFRKERFDKDPELKYEEGLTESELAELNGLRRVWDYGKVKWVKVVEKL